MFRAAPELDAIAGRPFVLRIEALSVSARLFPVGSARPVPDVAVPVSRSGRPH